MRRYVIEYDENSVAWLVDVDDKRRVALEHGLLVAIDMPDPIDAKGPSAPQEVPPCP